MKHPATQPPFKRIVSLAPAITEILFALEAAGRLVGVTDSCDYPDAAHELPNISAWFDPDRDKLLALEPDLVLGLETAHRQLKHDWENNGIQVTLVNPTSVAAALEDILRLGEMLDAAPAAQTCVQNLQTRLNALDRKVDRLPREKRLTVCRVLDLEGNQLIVAGPLSFQYDVITRAGGLNVSGQFKEAYPKKTLGPIRALGPGDDLFLRV